MQLKNVKKFRSVAERDIDMLLLEEFNDSDDFAFTFYSKNKGKGRSLDIKISKMLWGNSVQKAVKY